MAPILPHFSFRQMFESVETYYRSQAKIYNTTRWATLFGRNTLSSLFPDLPPESTILDLGCGTGFHINELAQKYKDSSVTGIDQSEEMIRVLLSSKNIHENTRIIKASWQEYLSEDRRFNMILCSYSLTMFKDFEKCIEACYQHLTNNGIMIVVDFNRTHFSVFESWMHFNHVQINKGLFEALNRTFTPIHFDTHKAYSGLWDYSIFYGIK